MTQFFILRDDSRKARCLDYIRSLKYTPPCSVEIKEYRANRSNAQNRTYWMWLNAMSPDLGYSADDLHELFKQRFLGLEEKIITINRNGKIIREAMLRPRSTANLTVGQFSEYLQKIEALATELGIRLVYPDDYKYAIYGT